MICEYSFFPTKKLVGGEDGFALLEAAGFVKTVSPGCIALLPFGVALMHKVAGVIRNICANHHFSEVALPLLQKYDLWEESGRSAKYQGLLCETTIGDKKFVINPTQEEAVLDVFRQSGFKVRDLPVRVFQLGERVRNEMRPAYGLIRSRSFTLVDLYALTRNIEESEIAAQELERIMNEIVAWANLPARRGTYFPSIMGVPTYSYWIPSDTKQCIVPVCRNCGASFRVREDLKFCPSCNCANFDLVEGVEIGDVMRSGSNLSSVMNVAPVNSDVPVYVSMMGLGVSRLLQLIAEYHHDDNGLVFPCHIAPFAVHIVTDETRSTEARMLHSVLEGSGYKVILDLRKQSIGRQLIDADLIGVPFRAAFGNKTTSGQFEVRNRRTGESFNATKEYLLKFLKEAVHANKR
jgi:prolyl-tRNA synthetase